jgi:lantibiotic biosynthesis protein
MYKSIFTKEDTIHAELEAQLHQLAADILPYSKTYEGLGLLGGKAGMALFFGYMAQHFNRQDYTDATFEMLNDLSEALSNEDMTYAMSNGVGGIAFTFQHLQRIGLIDAEDDLNLDELDEFLLQGIEADYSMKNWDPLHGFVGLGLYFLERNKTSNQGSVLEIIIEKLWELREAHNNRMIWMTAGYQNITPDNYNLGMAHGVPGIIAFLAQVYALDISPGKAYTMIEDGIGFLLENETKDAGFSRFPTIVEKGNNDRHQQGSRLGWCYGDTCIAFALAHAGKACNNKEWMEKGLEIARFTTQRSFENSSCADACICHGSAGMAHQFNRFWQLTGDEIFRDAAINWLQITFNRYYKKGEGIGGYFYYHRDMNTEAYEYVKTGAMLEGSAGIGLVFLSLISDTSPDWDITIMTNV